jgi:DNA excision repair protein ERCC-5
MGVKNLWKLLQRASKNIKDDEVNGRILAVDASIWIHHFIHGYRDTYGALLPNSHILGFVERIAKLLHLKIKPIFVFDGGTPPLKMQTVKERRLRIENASARIRLFAREILKTKLKMEILDKKVRSELISFCSEKKLLGENLDKIDPLNSMPHQPADQVKDSASIDTIPSSDELVDSSEDSLFDINSTEFKQLPDDMKQEMLVKLRQRRKEFTDPKIYNPAIDSLEFSRLQIKNVGARNSVALLLDKLKETKQSQAPAKRLASDHVREYVLIKNPTGIGWVLGEHPESTADGDLSDGDYFEEVKV